MADSPTQCPYCRGEAVHPVRFTAWGGIIGPLVFSLVKCGKCGSHFNGRNGRCVKKAIRLYTLTTLVVLVVLMAFVAYQFAGPRTGDGKGLALGRGIPAALIA